MADIISVRLGKELEKELAEVERKWRIDRSEIIRRLLDKAIKEWRTQNALEQLTAHKISLGKAAEEAGISILEMLDITKEKKIDWVGLTPEDIDRDLEIIKKLSKK